MEQEKRVVEKMTSRQCDHTILQRIRDQVILNTNSYLEDNGYNLIQNAGDENFSDTDMDSLDLMMLAEKISADLAIDMELTALIDYPSVQSLCEYIYTLMVSEDHHWPVATIVQHDFDDILVGITDVEEKFPNDTFHKSSPFQMDCIGTIPFDRWDIEAHHFRISRDLSSETSIRFGAFIIGIEDFDSELWKISLNEAKHMDPQQRILLEMVGELSVGHDISQTAVFVGASTCEYHSLIQKHSQINQFVSSVSIISAGISVLPGRLAFHLAMQGPAIATDTACSSGLVSLSIAMDMTENGTILQSYCCSSNLLIYSMGFRLFESANMLAPDGRCKAIDSSSDGFSRGEAVTALALEATSSTAHFQCVIRGTSINQDGRSSRLTAPNGPAQSTLLSEALKRSRREPSDIAKLMLHGTGTPLGDPIELGAALKLFAEGKTPNSGLVLNAVKTSMGHSEAAAGTVSLAGTISASLGQKSCPLLQLRELNHNVERLFKSFPNVSRNVQVYRGASCSIQHCSSTEVVGVSSFASQGTNCHAIIDFHGAEFNYSSEFKCIWYRKSIWILEQPKTRVALTSVRGHRSTYQTPMTNLQTPDGPFETFLSASIDIMKILHPLARGISSLVIINSHVSAQYILEITLDCDLVTANINMPTGRLEYANGMIQLLQPESLPEEKSFSKGLINDLFSIHAFSSHIVKSGIDIATTAAGDQTLALAKWRAVQKGQNIQRGCSLVSATVVVFHEACEATLFHDTYHCSYFSQIMRIEQFTLSTDDTMYPCRKDNRDFVYSHVDLIENADPILQDINSNKSHNFKIGDVTMNARTNQSLDPSLMALALGVFQQCFCFGKKGGTIRSSMSKQSHAISPLLSKQTLNFFDIILEAMGRTLNREMSPQTPYTREMKTLGMTVTKGLLKAHPPQYLSMECIFNADETTIVSGGTSGIGLLISDCLRNQGGTLISFSRSGTLNSVSRTLDATNICTSFWTMRKASASLTEDVANLASPATRQVRFVNAAGTLKDALIRNQAACNIFNISAPKQIGSERLLAYISLELPIKSFVAFSSIAALMHPSGSSIYAAANYAMENIISLSRMKGIESLTIQWGAWSSIGMVSGSTMVAKAMDALNVSLISPYQGICAFVHLMSLGYNKPSLYSCIPFRDNGNFLPIKSINGETSQAAKGAIDFVQHGVSLTVESVAQIIRQCVSNVLDTHIDSLSQSLIQFGADSLCAIEIQMALSKEFNIHLPSTFLFDYPNILAMADMISKNLGITSQDISIDENILGNETLGRMCPTLNIEAIFIRKPDGLSKLGLETPDCTKIVDFERWDPDFAHVIEANIRFGKFLTDIKLFDVELFNITSREARLMDPQQRLLLEDSFTILSHIYDKESSKVAVLVGMSFWDYSAVAERHLNDQGVALRLTSRNFSIASGRISYFHGYTGPCMTIDTACSSSLVGVHVAGKILHDDRLQSVRVGSAMLSLSPDVVKCLASASMTSDHGRSRTLDIQANGYGRGEATSFLSISRGGDGMAVIKGSAMNQDGRSATLTAPNGPSQVNLLKSVYHNCGILPSDTNLHELHGTGTQLGDPIEVHALVTFQAAQKKAGQKDIPLYLSATKTVFGHSEPVAGSVGIHSLINQMDNYFRDPLLHLTQVSVHVSQALQKTPRAMLPSRTKGTHTMEQDRSYASVNAFAFQGTNASIILSSNHAPICESLIHKRFAGFNRSKQWFIDKYHPTSLPIFSGSMDEKWLVDIKGNQMSKMKDHNVFGNALLPGVAIFRFMLDVADLSYLDSQGKYISLWRSSIHAPISLERDLELQITISRESSKICAWVGMAFGKHEFASGYCGQISETFRMSKTENKDSATYACLSRTECKDQRWGISIASLYCTDLVETINLPCIESIDASTHLAAYTECISGLGVSIPISCDALHIKPMHYLSGRQKMEGSASCLDRDTIECKRDYILAYHPENFAQMQTLTSKRIQIKSKESSLVSYLSQEDQLISPVDIVLREMRNKSHPGIPQVNRGTITVPKNEICGTWYLRLMMLLQEYIRTQMQTETSTFILPSTSERKLVEGQLRVASRELGLQSKVVQFNPNGTSMSHLYKTSTHMTASKVFETRATLQIPGSVLEGATVVVGGTNGIGLLYCQWAANYNVGRCFPIYALGKRGYIRGSTEHEASKVYSLSISSYNCSSSSDNNALLSQLWGAMQSTKCSIFYSAGVTRDTYYMTSGVQSYRTTFSPKYGGYRALTGVITPRLPCLELFSTSSMAIDIANIGQANYIASNTSMEILSDTLCHCGLKSRFARFGPWKGLGLLYQKETIVADLSRQGLVAMSPLQGIRAIINFLTSKLANSSLGILKPRSNSSILWKAPPSPRKAQEGRKSPLSNAMVCSRAQSETEDQDDMINQKDLYIKIRTTIQEVLGVEHMSDDSPFFEIGADSLSLIEIRNNLSLALKRPLPPTILFDYPTLRKLAKALCADCSEKPKRLTLSAQKHRDIYISSIAQVTPTSECNSFSSFCTVMQRESNLQVPVPIDRWENDAFFAPSGDAEKIYTYFGSFIGNIWSFDPEFFRLKLSEARYMDPQCRMLLHTTASALNTTKDAEIWKQATDIGVFVGCMFFDYLRIFEASDQGLDTSSILGNGAPYLSGRLAYTFDLTGTNIGIDTACSSSLVAIHCGGFDLLEFQGSLSVCCGANAILSPQTSIIICRLGALSRTGRSLSLDSEADGYGRGEAFASCILSLDSSKLALAKLNATCINQDGRSASMTAPNGPSQETLIKSCIARGVTSPQDISIISIHGTGTYLGDPLETQALSNVFVDQKVPVYLVSNKALFGHCEGAAGSTGFLNSLFSLDQKMINGIHTLRSLNSYVARSMKKRPLYATRCTIPSILFSRGAKSSGTSSFGMSGTNAHAILSNITMAKHGLKQGIKWTQPRQLSKVLVIERFRFLKLNPSSPSIIQISFSETQYSKILDHVIMGVAMLPAATQMEISATAVSKILQNESKICIKNSVFIRPFHLVQNNLLSIKVAEKDGQIGVGHEVDHNTPCSTVLLGLLIQNRVRERPYKNSGISVIQTLLKIPEEQSRNISEIEYDRSSSVSAEIDACLHLAGVSNKSCCVPATANGISISSELDHIQRLDYRASCNVRNVYESFHQLQGSRSRSSLRLRVQSLSSKPLKRNQLKDTFNAILWEAKPEILVDTLINLPRVDQYDLPRGGMLASRESLKGESLSAFQLLREQGLEYLCDKKYSASNNSYRYSIVKSLLRVYQTEHSVQCQPHTFGMQDSFESLVMSQRVSQILRIEPISTLALTSLGGLGSVILRYVRHQYKNLTLRTCSRKNIHKMSSRLSQYNLSLTNNDVAYREDSADMFGKMKSLHVLHTAGISQDALISSVTSRDILATMAPKVGIMDNIIDRNIYGSLCCLYSFSSIAQHFGSAGQSSYALSNSIMDIHSNIAMSTGMPCSCIQWGLWTSVGMAARLDGRNLKRLNEAGFIGLSIHEGLLALQNILSQSSYNWMPAMMVTKVDIAKLSIYLRLKTHLSHIKAALSPIATEISYEKGSLGTKGQNLYSKMDRTKIRIAITDIIQRYSDESTKMESSVPILQLGFDSVSSIELSRAIALEMDVDLPLTFIYDYPLLEDMVSFITKKKGGDLTGASIGEIRQIAEKPNDKKRVNILSIASRYPFEYNQTGYKWGESTTLVSKRPSSLNISSQGYFETFASAFRENLVYAFDADIFGFSEDASTKLDPNIRWALMLHYELFSCLGDGNKTDTGVYLGWMWSHEFMEESWNTSSSFSHGIPNLVTGNSAAFAVGHIAYAFNLSGPCVPVDTACSSSLVALHLSTQAIQDHDCMLATISGLNCFLADSTWDKIFSISAASSDGRCKTLDASADGYGRGEAFASMLITSEYKGEEILASVLGSAVKSIAHRSSLTAPHGPSQAEVIQDAIVKAGNQIISSISLHGTGTSLGDPIELQALTQTLQELQGISHLVNISSPKTAVGHTEGTAGITNMVASISCHQLRASNTIFHLRNLNPLTRHNLTRNLILNRQDAPLQCEPFSCSGSSSFGMSGVNSHGILGHTLAYLSTGPRSNAMQSRYYHHYEIIDMPSFVYVHHLSWALSPNLCSKTGSWINDHVVRKKALVPGTFFMSMATACAQYFLNTKSEPNFVVTDFAWIRAANSENVGATVARMDCDGKMSFEEEMSKNIICHTNIKTVSCCDPYNRICPQISLRAITAVRIHPVAMGALSSKHASQQDRIMPQSACLDAILHMCAIFSKSIYLPSQINCFKSDEETKPMRWAAATLPKYSGSHAFVDTLGGIGNASKGVWFEQFQGHVLTRNSDVKNKDTIYSLDLQAAGLTKRLEPCLGEIMMSTCNASIVTRRTRAVILALNPLQAFSAQISLVKTLFGSQIDFIGRDNALCYPKSSEWGVQGAIGQMLAASYRAETCLPSNSSMISTTQYSDDSCGEQKDATIEGSVVFKTAVSAQQTKREIFPDMLLKIPIGLPYDSTTYSNLIDMKQNISVHITSVGLNFRDVLVALGMYPSSIDRSNIGSDFSGYVRESTHSDFMVGDRVFGQSRGVFREQILVSPQQICHVPPNLTMEEASGIPTVFLTALYCIRCLPKDLTKSLLLHSASGGLGLAVVQLARKAGLHTVTTAGSPYKRGFLRGQGMQAHHGRSCMFVESIISSGQMMVCSVINTLTSPGMVLSSAAFLKNGGQFVEVSKRDIFSLERMLQDRSDIQYNLVAIDLMPNICIHNGLLELCNLLAEGAIHPTSGITFPLSSIQKAAIQFKNARNIGKIVSSRIDDAHDKYTWIITGGLGALGKLTSKVLLSQGNDVIVTARNVSYASNESANIGAMIRFILTDVNDRKYLNNIFEEQFWFTNKMGLVHSSGSLSDSIIPKLSLAANRKVFGSKTVPIMNILSDTLTHKLSIVISYSSISSIWANVGQANYSCANKILDHTATRSNQQGRNHHVINWGPWSGMGMAAALDRDILASKGIFSFDPKHAYEIFGSVLNHKSINLGTYQHICIRLSRSRETNLLQDDADQQVKTETLLPSQTARDEIKLTTNLFNNVSDVREVIRKILSSILPQVPNNSSPLMATGLDSLGIIDLVNELRDNFDQEFSPAFPFDYPTIDAMAERIHKLVGKNTALQNGTEQPYEKVTKANDRVFIDILDSFAMLPRQQGDTDCARTVPFDRWNVEHRDTLSRLKDHSSLRFGSFVDDIHQFDNQFFRVTNLEANIMDPQHRCLMYSLARIKGAHLADTAISIGIAKLEDPWDILHSTDNLIREGNGMVSTSRSAGAASGRLSFTFNFSGPSISIDTACSSSLVALKTLCDDTYQNRVSHGFVGGVSLPLNIRTSMMLAASSMLAVDGRCKTLDSSANGYGRAEGCVMLKLQISHSEESPENMQARLASTVVNQDGSSSSLTAPYGPSQESLFRKAIHYADILPSRLNITGTHGTGTALGDPIEISALTRALAQSNTTITLPSSKATYGHSETASGLLGMFYNLHILEKQRLCHYPSLIALNEHVKGPLNQASKHVRICRQAQPLGTITEPYFASVSAFAFQGTNALAIIEQQRRTEEKFSPPWIPEPKICMRYPAGHPLFKQILSTNTVLRIECNHTNPSIHLVEHRVRHHPIMPASCYLEVMMSVALTLTSRMDVAIQNITFKRPFKLREERFKISCNIISGDIGITPENILSDGQEFCSAGFTLCHERAPAKSKIEPMRSNILGVLVRCKLGKKVNGAISRLQGVNALTRILDSTWHLIGIQEVEDGRLHLPASLDIFAPQKHASDSATRDTLASLRKNNDDAKKHIECDSHTSNSTVASLKAIGLSLIKARDNHQRKGLGAALSILEDQIDVPKSQTESKVSLHYQGSKHSIAPAIIQLLKHWPENEEFVLGLSTFKGNSSTQSQRTNEIQACVIAAGKISEGPHTIPHTTLPDFRDVPTNISLSLLPLMQKSTIYLAGGTGAIGSLVQKWLCSFGSRIVMLSRRSFVKQVTSNNLLGFKEALTIQKTDVTGLEGADVGTQGKHEGQVMWLNLSGVLHDQYLQNVDIQSLRSVMAPKQSGTYRMAKSLLNCNVVRVLHFGSIASVLGNHSQASYILANSVLTSISKAMMESGQPSSVIHWGPWSLADGMANARVQTHLTRQGIPILTPSNGLQILDQIFRDIFRPEYLAFDRFGSNTNVDIAVLEKKGPSQESGYNEFSSDKVKSIIRSTIANLTGEEFKSDSSTFIDQGLDSISAVTFSEAMQPLLGISLPSTIIYDYPTIQDLAEYLIGQRLPLSDKITHNLLKLAESGEVFTVQISSVASRFPSTAQQLTLENAWRDGKEIQTITPALRWDIEQYYNPVQTPFTSYVRFAGWLRSIEMFEGPIFGLLPDECVTIDPQTRILLELTGEIRLQNSLYSSTSSFLGVMYNEYLDALLAPTNLADSQASSITSNGMSFLVGRISYHHGISGQAVACDTACSSSLVAAHMGFLSIKEGNQMTLAHGINIMLSPQTTARICLLHALSPSGRCKTADASADGYGRSESGCTICMRQPDFDSAQAPVVLGTGVAQNGKRVGLTAPHGPSQAALIASVQDQSQMQSQSTITSLHGTGTALGDPIEFSSLQTTRTRLSKQFKIPHQQRTVLMATKSCTGHMEGTAGLTGLILPLMCSNEYFVGPMAHLRSINRHISSQDFNGLYVARQSSPMVQSNVLAKVTVSTSSFGMSGTNAHLICGDEEHNRKETILTQWVRKRYWPLVTIGRIPVRFLHAQIGKTFVSFEVKSTAWLQEHRLNDKSILPGAAIMTLFLHVTTIVGRKNLVIQDSTFIKPVLLDGEPLTINVSGEGVSLHKNVLLMGKSSVSQRSVYLSFTLNRKNRDFSYVSIFSPAKPKVVATTANLAKAILRDEVSDSGDPRTLDASMHLALVTRLHDAQINVPVSVKGFIVEVTESQDRHTVCIGNLSACHVHSITSHQILHDIVTRRYHMFTEEETYSASDSKPSLFRSIGDDQDCLAPVAGSGKTRCTITNDSETVLQPYSWEGVLMIGSMIPSVPSKGKQITFTTGDRHGGANLMSLSVVKTLGRELPKVQLKLETSDQRDTSSGVHKQNYHQMSTSKMLTSARMDAFSLCLVTGAFGGIGKLSSAWLAYSNLNTIRLGRKGSGHPIDSHLFTEEVHIKCDISRDADLREVLLNSRRIQNLHHISGILKDHLIQHTTPTDLRETSSGKSITFGKMLDALECHGADRIMAYSSISSIFGNRGQVSYTYANSELNNACIRGRMSGINAVSIAWGPWSSIGMTLGLDQRGMEKLGIRSLSPAQGLTLLDTTMAYASRNLTSPIIIGGWFDDFDSMFLDVGTTNHEKEALKGAQPESINPITLGDIKILIEDSLKQVLQVPERNDKDSLGDLDSIQSVYVTERLSSLLGVALSPTVLYDYPSFSGLKNHLNNLLASKLDVKSIKGSQTENQTEKIVSVSPKYPRTLLDDPFVLRQDYYCHPQVETLNAMSQLELSSVSNFIIGRVGVGEVRFLCPVDLRNVPLHESLVIGKRSISLRGEHSLNPGEGLNQPALLVFRGASRKAFDSPNRRRRLRSRLIQTCQRIGGVLVHIDETRCEFMIKVDDWLQT